mmetsp:Transcript_26549/g.60572  ORF Transcript_26549/g.60572 Transcript_26549/m.60572 type:complete len:205 (+) Transcript_26549:232-846(+)
MRLAAAAEEHGGEVEAPEARKGAREAHVRDRDPGSRTPEEGSDEAGCKTEELQEADARLQGPVVDRHPRQAGMVDGERGEKEERAPQREDDHELEVVGAVFERLKMGHEDGVGQQDPNTHHALPPPLERADEKGHHKMHQQMDRKVQVAEERPVREPLEGPAQPHVEFALGVDEGGVHFLQERVEQHRHLSSGLLPYFDRSWLG